MSKVVNEKKVEEKKEELVKMKVRTVWASPEHVIPVGLREVPGWVADKMVELGTGERV